jgi:hypothetical protein
MARVSVDLLWLVMNAGQWAAVGKRCSGRLLRVRTKTLGMTHVPLPRYEECWAVAALGGELCTGSCERERHCMPRCVLRFKTKTAARPMKRRTGAGLRAEGGAAPRAQHPARLRRAARRNRRNHRDNRNRCRHTRSRLVAGRARLLAAARRDDGPATGPCIRASGAGDAAEPARRRRRWAQSHGGRRPR